jgi:death on curing protein
MTQWRWLTVQTILAVHEDQLAEHGGAVGVRDANMLESALARPLNLAAYGEPDAAALAAAYAYGIARNHPFVDGNKRSALVAAELFLLDNGYRMTASNIDCVLTFLALAAGELSEDSLAIWFRRHLDPLA